MLTNIPLIQAHSGNFNPSVRSLDSIKYIVIHYTGNIGDTAKNNVDYFAGTVTQTSAHYFINDTTIYQSVPDNHAAYAVGLGARTEPYFRWPTMWKKITNSNSISLELCGSKNSREATDETKMTAARLTVALLRRYNLTPSCVYRHYDVTGKSCPAWAVEDGTKWLDFQLVVAKLFYGEDEDEMTNSDTNYKVFKEFMARYTKELSETPATWETAAMVRVAESGLMDGTRPKSHVTRGELAQVLVNIENKK